MEFRTLVPEFAPTASSVSKDYAVIESTEELAALVAELQGRRPFQPESDHRRHRAGARHADRHRGVDGAARRRATSRSVTKGFGGGFSLAKSEALAMLAPVLTDPSVQKIGHDLKEALIVFGRHGIDIQNPNGFDTMLGSYLVDANRSSQALEPIVARTTRLQSAHRRRDRRQGRQGAGRLRRCRWTACSIYAGERSDLALQLAARVEPALEKDELLVGVSRSRMAAGANPRADRTHRRARRRQVAGVAVGDARSRDERFEPADLRAGRRRIQHRLAEAAGRDPVREDAVAGAQAHRHRPHRLNRGGSARRARRTARHLPVASSTGAAWRS